MNSMKSFFKKTAFFVVFCLLAFSCNKDDGGEKDNGKDSLIVKWEDIYEDIYFLGFPVGQENKTPYYYNNNQAYPLEYNNLNASVMLSDIVVASGDVYVTGNRNKDLSAIYSPVKALLWKNGEQLELHTPENTQEEATAVFVSGNDVYVSGSYVPADGGKRIGAVWKNGDPFMITNGNKETKFEDLFVSGDDIYAVGYEKEQGEVVARYWKNGNAVTLSEMGITTYAKSIVVDGADVYTLGYTDDVVERNLKLWKNNSITNLIIGESVVRGGKVVVENGHNYVCGYEQVGNKYEPRLFIDGAIKLLDDTNSGHTYATDLQVYHGNTLVLGRMQLNNSVRKPVLWLNGQMVNLQDLENEVSITAFDITPF